MRKHLATRDVLQDHVQIGIVLQDVDAFSPRQQQQHISPDARTHQADTKKHGKRQEKTDG